MLVLLDQVQQRDAIGINTPIAVMKGNLEVIRPLMGAAQGQIVLGSRDFAGEPAHMPVPRRR